MTVENLKNIQALLLKGKWELTAQESAILVNLVNTVGEEIKRLETPTGTDSTDGSHLK